MIEKEAADSALLKALMDATVDAMIISDARGTILRANPAAGRMFQYDVSELTGKSINMLMPNPVAEHHTGFMEHHMKTGENRIIGTGRDDEGMRKDKSIFPVHLSVGKAMAPEGPLFVAILHDLTRQRATLDALARSQRLDAIGQMTGGIAHDFNNLLTVVIGNLELLEMATKDEKQAALVHDALDAAELGADLTSRLMIFARKSNLKPQEADLRVLCNDTLAILKRTMGASYRVRTDFAPIVDHVMVDPVQLQSALMNLALNARDAMGAQGELLISIENITIDDRYIAQETDITPGHYVRLSVSDDGEGMNLEAQQRAFEPFFTTKSGRGGTGLGLAMVYGFVRQSGGHITLYSEVGHGTSFGVYFPAIHPTGPAQASGPSVGGGIEAFGTGKTVLVVEDNPKVRRLSAQRVRELGFSVVEAQTGDEAYQRLRGGLAVDIVFSDLVMPGELNGYDLAEKIAAEWPDLKVLLTSGYASDVISSKLATGQTYDVLHKPFRFPDLAARLQALLAVSSGT